MIILIITLIFISFIHFGFYWNSNSSQDGKIHFQNLFTRERGKINNEFKLYVCLCLSVVFNRRQQEICFQHYKLNGIHFYFEHTFFHPGKSYSTNTISITKDYMNQKE